jgi:hypothetical protein
MPTKTKTLRTFATPATLFIDSSFTIGARAGSHFPRAMSQRVP